jgi:hypothetical protein
MTMQQHFVTFYSPGTFVAETTTKPVDAWNVDDAVAMAAMIDERHGAKPYGFRFTTRGRAYDELDSKVIATGPMHYIGGKVETREEVFARNDPGETILRSNMESNGYDRIWTSTRGWKWTQPLQSDDVVIDA